MRKIAAALVVAVVLAFVASAWAVFGVRSRALELSQLTEREVVTLSALHELSMQAEAGARNARTLLLSGDDAFSRRLIAVRVTIARQMEVLRGRLTSPEQRALLARATQLRDRIYGEMNEAIVLMRAGDSHAASLRVLQRVEPLREQLADVLLALTSAKRAELTRLSSEQDRTSERALLFTGLLAGAALLCGVVLAALLQLAVKRESESELRLRHIFEGTSVGIIEEDYAKVDRALRKLKEEGVSDLVAHLEAHPELVRELVSLVEIRGINAAMRALIALPEGEQLVSLGRFFSADTSPVFRSALCGLFAGQRHFQSETIIRTVSGESVEALLTLSFPENMQREPVVVTLTDISAHKREERRSRTALEQSEARLQAVFDQCPVGITMSDVDGKLMYVNPAAQQIMAPTGGTVGARTLDLLTPEDRERVARWREEFLSRRTDVSELKLGLQTESGQVHTVRVQANLLREGDAVRGIVSTLEDVTERLRLEEELRQAQKMDAVGKLAGGVAHDFNNLLTVILNGASLLQEGASQDQSALLGQVEAAAERAASLTAQLLAFGRKQVIRPRVIDLNELVTNHCRMLQPLVGEKVQLCTLLDPSGAPAEVDPNLIELLLMNLVVNARDAMPLGGQIAIQLESLVTEAERGGAVVHLSVRDDGTGIDQQDLPHVFEPFFTTKTVGKGTGLGLSTVYGIVEQHHGRIDVDTVLGKGTTFHVYLPRASASLVASSEPLRGAPSGHETLLLVEDESAVRQMVATTLTRCGYRVIEAANGDVALELWARHAREIDLLLTDMVMPGSLSGRDLAVKLRSQRPELKVVYMSGYGAHDLAGEPWSILVQKPFQMASLAQVLRARLDQNEPAMPTWLMHAGLSVQQRVFQA